MKHLILILIILVLPFYVKAQSLSEHTVSTGETLQAIASKYGVAISDLRNANSGLDDYVFAGMVLKIPSKGTSSNDGSVIPLDDLKDIIYLKDGSELVSKVLSIEANEVKFEQYDTDDPFTIPKNEITSIKFEDGRMLDFTILQKKKTNTTKKRSPLKKTTR
jgi:LysM repeat protein